MNILFPAVLVLNLIASPFSLPSFDQSLDAASEAFAAGDTASALRHLDDAIELLRGVELEQFLPEPPLGSSREIVAYGLGAVMSNMYGGVNGSAVKAEYVADGKRTEITLISDQLMLAGVMMQYEGATTIGGQVFMQIEGDDRLHARVGRVIIWISGTTSLTDKTALIELMDFQAIEAYR